MDNWFKFFKDCPFAKFVCADCLHLSRELSHIKEQLALVSASVTSLSNTVIDGFDKLKAEFTAKTSTNTFGNASHIPLNNIANRGEECSTAGLPNTAHHQFQLPQLECIVGSSTVVDEQVKSVPDKKFIYASRFMNSTTIEALKKFLTERLAVAADVLDCRLLVSANQDVNRLNFVSFKIGVVDPLLFNKLLQPDVWPTGVLVRKFVSRPKNSIPVELK